MACRGSGYVYGIKIANDVFRASGNHRTVPKSPGITRALKPVDFRHLFARDAVGFRPHDGDRAVWVGPSVRPSVRGGAPRAVPGKGPPEPPMGPAAGPALPGAAAPPGGAAADACPCSCPFRAHRSLRADREVAGHRAAPGAPREPRGVAQQVGAVRQRRAADPAPHRALPEREAHLGQRGSRPREDFVPAEPATPGQAAASKWQSHEAEGAEKEVPDLHWWGEGANGHLR